MTRLPGRAAVWSHLALAACAAPLPSDLRVEVGPYIASFCESLCAVGEICVRDWYLGEQACLHECTEARQEEAEQDPCFVHVRNLDRCRYDNLTCAELERAPFLPPEGDGPCAAEEGALAVCLADHPDARWCGGCDSTG